MNELTRIRLRTLGWFALFPVTLVGLFPWWLHKRFEGPFVWDGTLGSPGDCPGTASLFPQSADRKRETVPN